MQPTLRDVVSGLRGDTAPTARLFPWDFRPGNALLADGDLAAILDWEAPLAAPAALSVAKREYLVADSAVDSTGAVTNPGYPELDRNDAVVFHRRALERAATPSP